MGTPVDLPILSSVTVGNFFSPICPRRFLVSEVCSRVSLGFFRCWNVDFSSFRHWRPACWPGAGEMEQLGRSSTYLTFNHFQAVCPWRSQGEVQVNLGSRHFFIFAVFRVSTTEDPAILLVNVWRIALHRWKGLNIVRMQVACLLRDFLKFVFFNFRLSFLQWPRHNRSNFCLSQVWRLSLV